MVDSGISQDDIAAALADEVSIYAWHGMSKEEFYWAIERTLEFKPTMTLDDGADLDKQTDGCIKVMTLNDLTAEPTGGFFDPTGTHYYVSIQHNISGHGVILDITGWR